MNLLIKDFNKKWIKYEEINIAKILFFGLSITLIQSTSNAQSKKDYLIDGLKNIKIFKETIFNNKNFSHTEYYTIKNFKAKPMPEFRIKFESQIGISIRPTIANSKNYAERLEGDFYINTTAGKNLLQIGEHDFDNDKNSEIVVCFGVKGQESTCSIYKYFEPNLSSQTNRNSNWKKIGSFENSGYDPKFSSYVERDEIHFPIGSQGVNMSYKLIGEKFIELK